MDIEDLDAGAKRNDVIEKAAELFNIPYVKENPGEIFALLGQIKQEWYKHYDGPVSEKASLEFVCTAYGHILDNGGDHNEALGVAAMLHECTEDYINEVKHARFYGSKEVVKNFDDHPQQKRMVKEKVMDKSALRKSETPTQLLKRLADDRGISDRLEALERENVKIHKELSILKAQNMNKPYDLKDQARSLREMGWTYQAIADEIGKTKRTIINWLKD